MTAPPATAAVPFQRIEQEGYALVPHALDDAAVEQLVSALEAASFAAKNDEAAARLAGAERASSLKQRATDSTPHAIRNLLDVVPSVRALAASEEVRALVEPVLGKECFAVRGILFDKTPGANWKVPWHQDLSVAVRERADVEGFGPWSRKAGVWHVQPPEEVLQRMLTLRLHLDACDEDNGPLRVLPGSHRAGKLDAPAIARWREGEAEVSCLLPRGGALLMRPLLLHASSPAARPARRRVIHLEWATGPLPGGLQWRD